MPTVINEPIDKKAELDEALKLGLLESEYKLICEKLKRTPTFTELSMFSGMWSEHCSYKNSILLLRELYNESSRSVVAAGEENAGALKINDKQAVVFKIESHNHPSALEPYQGAATGVGGIMRDIFTMGARPLVTLNSLRFGLPQDKQNGARNRYLLSQTVKGIGDYGNSLGIACAGGEIVFHESFSKNPLVNAMTVGIVELDKMASAKAKGIDNIVLYVGAKTGRDGIHGASFASKELSNESAQERSAVQVGDPFMEKLLMEATLECIEKKLVVAVQDMGAAGLVSSSTEMSASGGVGMDIDIDRVPAREQQMQPFEFLLSESQERMLMVVEPHKVEAVQKIFERWELEAVAIGKITDTKNMRIFFHGKLYADVPARYLSVDSEGAPRYKRESKMPKLMQTENNKQAKETSIEFFKAIENGKESTENFIAQIICHPNLCSKEKVYHQYDTDIGIKKIIGPGQNGGVYRVPDSSQALAVSVDGNSFYVKVEPYAGAQHGVAESFRNVTANGATAIGLTNCLNFANPYKPENFYFFEQAVKGMSNAARFFATPITGGNVSFYNESEDGPVLPTPTVSMVGLLDNAEDALGITLQSGHNIYLLGFFAPELACSQFRYILKGEFSSPLPNLELSQEKQTADVLLAAIQKQMLLAANDISAGGLFMTLLRMLFASNETADNFFEHKGFVFANNIFADNTDDNFFWGESAASYLVQVNKELEEQFLMLCKEADVPCQLLGQVTDKPQIDASKFSLNILALQDKWKNALNYF